MKYKVGDKVRIKSLDWYNENKDEYGYIDCGSRSFFTKMSDLCGKIATIKEICKTNCYRLEEYDFDWTDEMIEGLVEEETQPKFKVGDRVITNKGYIGKFEGWVSDYQVRVLFEESGCNVVIHPKDLKLAEEKTKPKLKFKVGDEVKIKVTDIVGTVESIIRGQLIVNYKDSKIPAWPEDVVLMESVEEEVDLIPKFGEYSDNEPLDIPTMTTEFVKEHGLPCPEGYIFKDENDNIINATKIVLEKKKKEYPKTFEECVHVLEGENRMSLEQMNTFRKLIDSRNAYWKLYGEEMGLGKPWKPDWTNLDQLKYCIWVDFGEFTTTVNVRGQHILAFPTEEMRDAFYENFKSEIEICKELL